MSSSKKILIHHSEKKRLFLTALLTAVFSELKIIPFAGEAFRFGLGSITFFLLILIWPPASLLRTGFVTGVTVVCFRILEDIIFFDISLGLSIMNHLPTFLFYFLFALGLHLIKVEKYKTSPLVLGAWAALFEFIGNGAEQLIRHLILDVSIDPQIFSLLAGVAIIRSYFVVGLYSSTTVSEQKKRMQEMLGVGSELYAESLYLQKSMNHIEQITASSHELYRSLKKKGLHELSAQALYIAQEIHEVKKDSQRILSGLTKLTKPKKGQVLLLSDVVSLIVSANKKYSELLTREIAFHVTISSDFETNKQIPLLALLNNLIANAVEAITKDGEISLEIHEEGAFTCFTIRDTGKGIPKEDISIIFEPGYTTKYNNQGVAATGIGLSHVKDIVHMLEGKIEIESQEGGAIFQVFIPTKNLRK